MKGARSALRVALGGAAVLSETEAVALLPGRDAVARAWLRENGLVRVTALGRVVVWGDVVEALRGPAEAPAPATTAGRLPRAEQRRRP